jgi:ribosomal protein S27E
MNRKDISSKNISQETWISDIGNSKSKTKSFVNRNELDEAFLEKLNEYYKLKNEYETRIQTQKNGILKDSTLTMKRKQEKYRKMKVKCINCGRNVGTIFENNSNILTAICGDILAPCKLDIKINRGKFVHLEDLMYIAQESVDNLKEEIIETKLDLLFGYETETNTLTKFTELKELLTGDLELVLKYKTHFIEIISNLDNKSTLNTKMTVFYNKISLIKSTIEEFNETGQIQLIKDMIILYDTEMTPLLAELRNLKYKYMAMEYDIDTDTHRLVKNIYTLHDMNIEFDIPKIESFIIGNDKTQNTQKILTNVLRDDFE